jgi:Domain of unknown function (DUF4926)
LPNGERALIPMEKLTDFCLNPDHARGKDKARVFASVLGITRDRAHELADLVRQAARDGDITKEARTVWGQYYRVDWAMPSRVDVVLRTIWEIAPGAEIPRLVSVFIRWERKAGMGYPKLLDVVALLQSLPPATLHLIDERYDLSTGLEVGAVGTIVEAYPRDGAPSACLVEFSDARGCGYAFAMVPVEALLVLHYVPSEATTAPS